MSRHRRGYASFKGVPIVAVKAGAPGGLATKAMRRDRVKSSRGPSAALLQKKAAESPPLPSEHILFYLTSGFSQKMKS